MELLVGRAMERVMDWWSGLLWGEGGVSVRIWGSGECGRGGGGGGGGEVASGDGIECARGVARISGSGAVQGKAPCDGDFRTGEVGGWVDDYG